MTQADHESMTRLCLRVERLKQGVRQREMCAALNVDPTTYYRIEKGEQRIRFEEIRVACLRLGIPLATFEQPADAQTWHKRYDALRAELALLVDESAEQRKARRQRHLDAA